MRFLRTSSERSIYYTCNHLIPFRYSLLPYATENNYPPSFLLAPIFSSRLQQLNWTSYKEQLATIRFLSATLSSPHPPPTPHAYLVGEGGELITEAYFVDARLGRCPREGIVLLLELSIQLFIVWGRKERSQRVRQVQICICKCISYDTANRNLRHKDVIIIPPFIWIIDYVIMTSTATSSSSAYLDHRPRNRRHNDRRWRLETLASIWRLCWLPRKNIVSRYPEARKSILRRRNHARTRRTTAPPGKWLLFGDAYCCSFVLDFSNERFVLVSQMLLFYRVHSYSNISLWLEMGIKRIE